MVKSAAGIPFRRSAPAALAMLSAQGLVFTLAAPVLAKHGDGPNAYDVQWLVSDQPGVAAHQDTHLVNGWGIAASTTSPWWVSNNGTSTSTLYDGAGTPFPAANPRVVSVPGDPTGMVFNSFSAAGKFPVSSDTGAPASSFIWASEDGTISGWNPNFPAAASNQAFVIASHAGANYKGLAIGGAGYLYAADFHNGAVDVYDGTNGQVTLAGSFTDPKLPKCFAPFGIQALGGMIFVSFAKQDADAADEVAGHGLGVVDAFSTDGVFLDRVAAHGQLNAPWGLAMAPATGFGEFSGDLIVGNFGDGQLNAFRWDGHHWHHDGELRGSDHHPVSVDGLWGIGFGNGATSGPMTTLYFAAGPDDEMHGLFGSITAGT